MWKWNVEPASAIEIDGWMDGGGDDGVDKMRRWYIMCTHLSYYISYEKIPDVNTLIYQRHFTVAKPTIKASCLKRKIPKRSHIRSTEMKMLSNSRSPSYWAWTLSPFLSFSGFISISESVWLMRNHSIVIYNERGPYTVQPKSTFIYMCVVGHMHCCRVRYEYKCEYEYEYASYTWKTERIRFFHSMLKKTDITLSILLMWPMSCKIILHNRLGFYINFQVKLLTIQSQIIIIVGFDGGAKTCACVCMFHELRPNWKV